MDRPPPSSKPVSMAPKTRKSTQTLLMPRRTLVINVPCVSPLELGLGLEEVNCQLVVKRIRANSEGLKHFEYEDIVANLNGVKLDSKTTLKAQMEQATTEHKTLEFRVLRIIPPGQGGGTPLLKQTKSVGHLIRSTNKTAMFEFLTYTIENNAKEPGVNVFSMRNPKSGLTCMEIANINEDSPFVGKLQPGDWIMSLNGETAQNNKSFTQHMKSQVVVVTVARGTGPAGTLKLKEYPNVLEMYKVHHKPKVLQKVKSISHILIKSKGNTVRERNQASIPQSSPKIAETAKTLAPSPLIPPPPLAAASPLQKTKSQPSMAPKTTTQPVPAASVTPALAPPPASKATPLPPDQLKWPPKSIHASPPLAPPPPAIPSSPITPVQMGKASKNPDFEPSFIEPPTEIREVMGEDKQKEIIKWRLDNLEDGQQDMNATLEVT